MAEGGTIIASVYDNGIAFLPQGSVDRYHAVGQFGAFVVGNHCRNGNG